MRLAARLLSSAAKIDVAGIFPPIATPFRPETGAIAYDKLSENFSQWATKGFRGYVVMGSNGEFPYLSEDERLSLVEACRKEIPSSQLLLAGAGCEGTAATVDMCNKMADKGADAALVHTPCFYKGSMTPAAIQGHYEKVADGSKIPVILYNVPANTGIDMEVETVAHLSAHSNIIAVKDSSGNLDKLDKITKLAAGPDFQVLAGSAGFLLPALRMGCVGGVVAAGNLLGSECVELCQLHAENNQSKADALQERLIAPNLAITRKYGVPALKYMMDQLGYYGGPVRSPLLPLGKKQREEVKLTFVAAKLLPQ